jgi:hypothetical protein
MEQFQNFKLCLADNDGKFEKCRETQRAFADAWKGASK